MTRGGARVRSGPAPDPQALRRERDGAEWARLPAAGRPGSPPEWPLTRPTARERVLWAREWTRPQALMWEANGQASEVALYVRSLAAAERSRAPVNARTLVRQQMDALGLTVPGLRMNRWTIVDDEPQELRSDARTPGPSVRDRLQIVAGGEG